MAHIRHSRPDYGSSLQVKVLKIFEVVPSLLRDGTGKLARCIQSKDRQIESSFSTLWVVVVHGRSLLVARFEAHRLLYHSA